jgi:hypothetical protein
MTDTRSLEAAEAALVSGRRPTRRRICGQPQSASIGRGFAGRIWRLGTRSLQTWRRSMSKREAARRTDALIETMQRLSREGKEPAAIAKRLKCSEELVVAVLRTYPSENEGGAVG